MNYTGLFKRIIPFIATFAAGLLLASFFVSITPNFRSWRAERHEGRCRDKRQLKFENETLRERLRATEGELREARRGVLNEEFELSIPEPGPAVEFEAHHPPKPPRKPTRPERMDTLR